VAVAEVPFVELCRLDVLIRDVGNNEPVYSVFFHNLVVRRSIIVADSIFNRA
jgi:hypothetical protein